MKRDDRIEELKKKYFSEDLRNYFEENHKSMQKNIQIFKDLKASTDATLEDTALLMMFSSMGGKIWEAIDMMSDEMEGIHLANFILRKKIKNMEETLTQQGQEIDRDYDDVLRFLDFYVKKNSDINKEDNKEDD